MTTPRNVIEELTRTGFIANEEQIEALARFNLLNMTGTDAVRGIYLKSLIVGVQREIDKAQLEPEPATVLAQVHEKYYAAVVRAVTPKNLKDDPQLPREERKARAQERNRRGNFARSAKSTVLAFIKAGGDIMQLNAATITKVELTAFSLAMRSTVATQEAPLIVRVGAAISKLEELIRELADQSKGDAVDAVEATMDKLSVFMEEIGMPSTTRSDEAVRDHKLLRLPAGQFWPVVHSH